MIWGAASQHGTLVLRPRICLERGLGQTFGFVDLLLDEIRGIEEIDLTVCLSFSMSRKTDGLISILSSLELILPPCKPGTMGLSRWDRWKRELGIEPRIRRTDLPIAQLRQPFFSRHKQLSLIHA